MYLKKLVEAIQQHRENCNEKFYGRSIGLSIIMCRRIERKNLNHFHIECGAIVRLLDTLGKESIFYFEIDAIISKMRFESCI